MYRVVPNFLLSHHPAVAARTPARLKRALDLARPPALACPCIPLRS